MFFSIEHQRNDNFSEHHVVGNFCISVDRGWKFFSDSKKTCIYKGYADFYDIDKDLDLLIENPSQVTGCFCILLSDTHDEIKIITDRYRGFPIYSHIGKCITNLVPGDETYWSDGNLKIDKTLSVIHQLVDIIGDIDSETLHFTEVKKRIISILDKKTQAFISNNKRPIKVYLSGGVDTLLVFGALQKYTKDYDFVLNQHIDFDRFWIKNSGTLTKNWGYQQIHHWIEPCVLTSGAPGDEYTLRSPVTADLWLKYHGVNMIDILSDENNQKKLHWHYFNRDKHLEIFKTQTIDTTQNPKDFFWHLCNIILNDWQHWHLGNTLTWCPLRDLDIFKLIIRLPLEDAIEQIIDSKLSIALIEHYSPGLSRVISDKKNTENVMANLHDFYRDLLP